MKFSHISQVFNEMEKISSRLEMTRLFADLLKQATPSESKIICYLALGQLKPPYIGTQFQVAEKNFIKVVAQLLGLDEPEVKKMAKVSGDLGLVVESGKWRQKEDLTALHVYKELENIEEISGIGSQEGKISALVTLLENLDPISAKYIARIVIGKMRLGFSDMTIIDALSWMEAGDKSLRKSLENAYNICADIGLIAQTLKDGGVKAIENMKIQVGVPIRPAAAERMPTAKAIVEKLGECIAQPKLDGFRLQIHLDKTHSHSHAHENAGEHKHVDGSKATSNPVIRFFSRNLIDMSHMFPDIAQEIIDLDVKELICEGEAIVYDPNTGNFLPFQETVKRKRKHDIENMAQQLPLQVFIFDLLYLDGQEYLTKTYTQRRKELLHLFKNYKGEDIKVIEERKIEDAKELENYFIENIASGLEGLVVKKPDSHYEPGKRNFNWIKLKRQEETGGLEDTLDCVVLGYYFGKGKRSNFGLGAFLVGVYNKHEDVYQTIAKIGTGMTDLEWEELKAKCDKIVSNGMPKNVRCPKELAPDVWVYPEIVCAIRADDITLSPLHTAGKTSHELGFALRFPRFMGYRPDKSSSEVTTVTEVKHLYKDQHLLRS